MDNKPLLRVFDKHKSLIKPPPIWLMRQAGRYLPQYKKLRAQAGSFLNLCYNPKLAAQATLEPVQRFELDGAIIFADILLLPHGLGQALDFKDGEGPCLGDLRLSELRIDNMLEHLAPVFEAIANVKARLPKHVTLIGFCGAPWTVASYMIAGGSDACQRQAKKFSHEQPQNFDALIDLLVEASVHYLLAQYKAGAELLQIFDSWAGSLDGEAFARYSTRPVAQIIDRLRAAGCHAPVLVFPKSMSGDILAYAAQTRASGISLSHDLNLSDIAAKLPQDLVLQGNLAPDLLVNPGEACRQEIHAILTTMQQHRHIFNLGHGVLPQTKPEQVATLVQQVRGLTL